MFRGLLVPLSVLALFLAGCSSKPKNGECKSSDDCKSQQGYGKICVEGRCQECSADTDCEGGMVCRDNKCMPKPECAQDADCGAGRTCVDGRCSAPAECTGDAQCGPGQACEAGKCVSKQADASAADACGGEEHAVRFAFDRADIADESRAILNKFADCVKQAGAIPLAVEGHADERGTTEYNVQLGQRRAEAVKRYLANLGLDAGSMKVVSYGKERPLCSESSESCWARNRRGVVRGQQ